MTLAMEKIIVPGTGYLSQPNADRPEQLNISVVFTSPQATLEALKEAGSLASCLGARITLVVPQVVPYPLPLESPPTLLEFSERRFRLIAGASRVETVVQLYLCRDRTEMLTSILKPGSIIVIGGRKRWWISKEQRMARQLRRAGFEVVFKETE